MNIEAADHTKRNISIGWTRWVMGIKKSICCNEHWASYVSDESLNSTSETNTALYVS